MSDENLREFMKELLKDAGMPFSSDDIGPEDLDKWLETGVVPGFDDMPVCHKGYRNILESSALGDAVIGLIARDKVIADYGFALPCREAVHLIGSCSPLLEIGAGTGYWSDLLAKRGANIIATDPAPTYDEGYGMKHSRFIECEALDGEEAVRKYPERNVLLIWPATSDWPERAIRAMKPGRRLLLITEGSCGTDEFYGYLDEAFEEKYTQEIPQWPGMRDRLTCHLKT